MVIRVVSTTPFLSLVVPLRSLVQGLENQAVSNLSAGELSPFLVFLRTFFLRNISFKSLRFLGLECLFLDIDRDSRGRPVVSQWPPRLTLWSSFEAAERLGEDGEWLLRYNRDIEDLST